jgi:hypothetical protein
MRNPLGGAVGKFPDLNTIEEVIDMVVMCIHIASPQNTAVSVSWSVIFLVPVLVVIRFHTTKKFSYKGFQL